MKTSFQRIGVRHVIAAIVLVAWVVQGLWISPFSSQEVQVFGRVMQNYADENKKTIEELDRKGSTNVDPHNFGARVKTELQRVRTFWLIVVIIGLSAALMMFFDIRFWRTAISISSLVYLWAWYYMGTTAYVGPIQAYRAKIMLAEDQGTMGWFLMRDVFLPILFISMIAYVTANYIGEIRTRSSRSPG